MSLRPQPTVQKALISTTSRFVGEYEDEDLLVAHAWPAAFDPSQMARAFEGPSSRSSYVISFKTEPQEPGTRGPIPDYSPVAPIVCSLLSVLYGKRFDNHGLIESSGRFHRPDLSGVGDLSIHTLPQNSHRPRVDLEIPLNLVEIARIRGLLAGSTAERRFLRVLYSASRFYWQALRAGEREPEMAYLHLITAGELLAGYHEFGDDVLLDDELKALLQRIRQASSDGDELAR